MASVARDLIMNNLTTSRRVRRCNCVAIFLALGAGALGHTLSATKVLPDIPAGTLPVKLTLAATNLHNALSFYR